MKASRQKADTLDKITVVRFMDDENEDMSFVDSKVEALQGDIHLLELERKKSEEAADQLKELLPKAEEVGELAAQDVKGYGKIYGVYTHQPICVSNFAYHCVILTYTSLRSSGCVAVLFYSTFSLREEWNHPSFLMCSTDQSKSGRRRRMP